MNLIENIGRGTAELLVAEALGDTAWIERAVKANEAMLDAAAVEAGVDLDALHRDMNVKEEELLSAASTLGALYGATGLLELKEVAYAVVGDLYAWAQGARERDKALGTDVAGGLLQTHADLRQPMGHALTRFKESVEKRAVNDPGRALVAARVALLRQAYGLTEDEDTLIQLMALKATATGFLARALNDVAYVGGEPGFGHTATAVIGLVQAMRRLAQTGSAIAARTGTQLLYGSYAPVMASLDGLEAAMRHVLEHGSDAGFDYATANATVRKSVEKANATPTTPLSVLDKAVRSGQEADVRRAMEEAA